MRDRIEQVLNQVRPALRMDGGDIQLVSFDEATGVVRVRLEGACRGCPMSKITLKMGIEMALTDAFPDVVKEVVSVDDEDAV
ncbi:MAG: NifU family protein [Candidatus Uhrbacteria bacterium]